jgi:hypothetical protein
MNRAMKIFLISALAITTSGAAMAGTGSSYICAYVNDNVDGQNYAEGYKVGPGDAVAHVGPYATNGLGGAGVSLAGGLAAARVKEGDLYVYDESSANITHFTINKTDCTLTLDTTLYPTGHEGIYGQSLAITPDGRTMFLGSTGTADKSHHMIYSQTISAGGSLGPAVKEARAPSFADGFEVSPDGKTLVVSFVFASEVCAFPISGRHLGTPNCRSAGGSGVSIDPASACVYAAVGNPASSKIVAFTLTEGVLGPPTYYNSFGPGAGTASVLVNWDNKAIYATQADSAQIATGSIAPGCKLTYESIISDGSVDLSNLPAQIAQSKSAHGYVVTGDGGDNPGMGIFSATADGRLSPIDGGRFPLMRDGLPASVVVVGVE